MPKKNWTDELEQLLVTWAEKASGYAWLHQKSAILFKKKNLCISIPSCIFGYLSGITLLLSNDVFNNCSDISYYKIFEDDTWLATTSDEFYEIVNKHRNDEIWDKKGNSWILKHKPI